MQPPPHFGARARTNCQGGFRTCAVIARTKVANEFREKRARCARFGRIAFRGISRGSAFGTQSASHLSGRVFFWFFGFLQILFSQKGVHPSHGFIPPDSHHSLSRSLEIDDKDTLTQDHAAPPPVPRMAATRFRAAFPRAAD
jgi:hypothetical protein